MIYKELLMKITENAREEKELEELKEYFINIAKEGKDIAVIGKIDQKFPTIYKNGSLWNWLKENDIHCSGSADKDGKNAGYSFWWK